MNECCEQCGQRLKGKATANLPKASRTCINAGRGIYAIIGHPGLWHIAKQEELDDKVLAALVTGEGVAAVPFVRAVETECIIDLAMHGRYER